MRKLGLASLLFVACSAPTTDASTVREHGTLESLMEVASWPSPSVRTVGTLVTVLVASELDGRGYDYFARRATETEGQKEHPWFLGASGLFQVRLADEVPLLRRAAWVREGMAKLEAAVEADPGFSRYLRGATFSQLPPRFDAASTAIEDLEWVLEHRQLFPSGTDRAALRYLAAAKVAVGDDREAKDLLERSGHASLDGSEPVFSTPYSVTADDGFRFGAKEVEEVAPGLWLASGYDFTDIAFIETDDGLIAIDAGTHPDNAAAALAAVREETQRPVTHLILTHSHWDHVGGAQALIDRSTAIVAQGRFDTAIEQVQGIGVPFRWFFGRGEIPLDVRPTRFVATRERLEIGGRNLELIPVSGGETEDALLIHLPESGVLFVGDVFMPYFGAPFAGEGSPAELIRTIEVIERLGARLLIHGHRPLTENFTIGVLPELRQALTALLEEVRDGLRAGVPAEELLDANILPESLRSAPDAVLPYLIMRDNAIQRMYELGTGYWKADGSGVDDLSEGDWARAFELIGNGEQAYVRAAQKLLDAGEAVLPLKIAEIGLRSHPEARELTEVRRRALQRLRAKNQVINPFKLIVYSERLGIELPPLTYEE